MLRHRAIPCSRVPKSTILVCIAVYAEGNVMAIDRREVLCLTGATAAVAACPQVARGEPYPSRPVRILFQQFLDDKRAATAIEYGLIAAGISVAIIAVVANLGSALNTTFTSV